MIVLAIETATGAESVALITEKKVLSEVNVDIEFGHSSTLLNNIDKVFKSDSLDISSVSAIAVSAGPGSFTGLRVGFALAKGLAYASKKPFYTIPTLDALAFAYSKTAGGVLPKPGKKTPGLKLLCPLLDARKNEYYFSAYTETKKGLARLLPFNALPFEVLLKDVKKLKPESIVFFGNGTTKCGEEILKAFGNASLAEVPLRAAAIGGLALLELAKEKKQDFNKALPLYVRKPDAVISKAKNKK
jgi:tRNA threonylcarbamoyl adenosine modification protein YeaZ